MMKIAGNTAVQRQTPIGTTGKATNTSASSFVDPAKSGIEGDFLKLAHMTPMERMRAGILKSMNLSEDQIAKFPADERKKIEDEIKEKIKEKVSKNAGPGQLIDLKA